MKPVSSKSDTNAQFSHGSNDQNLWMVLGEAA
ncbi:Uncharacterised protein [Mycobacteroides abscessus subsp. abscessus]|nr:Uncharacterised protein [Mycobacteroides abscessus subsp. abscessus]